MKFIIISKKKEVHNNVKKKKEVYNNIQKKEEVHNKPKVSYSYLQSFSTIS